MMITKNKKGYKKTSLGGIPEEWEAIKLGEIANILYGKSPKDILDNDGKFAVIGTSSEIRKGNDYIYDGETIIIGRKGTIDNPFYYNGKSWIIDTAFYMCNFRNCFAKYIFYIMFLLDLKKYNEATGVPSLSRTVLINLEIPLPPLSEQKKIADILSTWDRVIELKEKLIEEKRKQKKALMQMLLTGKFRLSGFTEEWKNVKIGEIVKFIKKTPIKNSQEYYLLTVKLHLKGIEFTNKKPNVTTNARPYYIRNSGEILIGRQNFHNGGIGIVPESKQKYIASNAISSIEIKKGNEKFCFYYLSNPNFYKKVENMIGGTGQKEISEKSFLELKVYTPENIEEQKAIANILSLSDKEIELLEQELEALKLQKKGLMQLLLTGIIRVKV